LNVRVCVYVLKGLRGRDYPNVLVSQTNDSEFVVLSLSAETTAQLSKTMATTR